MHVKEKVKQVQSVRGWGVGIASEAGKKNSKTVDIFGKKRTY